MRISRFIMSSKKARRWELMQKLRCFICGAYPKRTHKNINFFDVIVCQDCYSEVYGNFWLNKLEGFIEAK